MAVVAVGIIVAFISTQVKAKTVAPIEVPVDILTHQQRAWLGALEWCESGGNPKAINPKDKDNTPSYGILQFKPSTFNYFSGLYNITVPIPVAPAMAYMNPEVQILIVEQMIIREEVNWHQQFPACTSKLGLPPVSTTSIDKN